MGARHGSIARRLGIGAIIVAAVIGMSNTSRAEQRRHPKRKPETALISKLQQEIMQRDALIRSLLSRVERLERHDGISGAANRHVAGNVGQPSVASGVAPSNPEAAAKASEQGAANLPAEAPEAATAPPPQAAAPAPGQFTVSPEAAEHALERALEQSGALLLQPGKFQLVPSVAYQFQQATEPNRLALTTSGTVLVTQDVLRANQAQAGTLLRAGLPWASQLEIGIPPYVYKSRSTTERVLGTGLSDGITDAFGFGDPTIALTKQVSKEGEWLPNLFLRGAWNADLGQVDKGLPLGMGFNQFSTGLLASKRQDPLVFTAGFTYLTNLEHHGVAPGDQFTPSLGMLFAVSPETSLQLSQQAAFIEGTRLNGATIPGSSSLQATFTAGLLSILAPGIVVQFLGTVGETKDAPDLTLQLAFPINLN
jgi:hypothetical protein